MNNLTDKDYWESGHAADKYPHKPTIKKGGGKTVLPFSVSA
jgi:hypothetical protein